MHVKQRFLAAELRHPLGALIPDIQLNARIARWNHVALCNELGFCVRRHPGVAYESHEAKDRQQACMRLNHFFLLLPNEERFIHRGPP